jgi:hypothetical protein
MSETTGSGTFKIGDYDYPVDFFNITTDDENYFCGKIVFTVTGEMEPDVNPEESYVGRLKTKTGEWYFPWLWFKETTDEKLLADTHGAIFVPGQAYLSEEDEARYDAINLIVSSEVYMAMTEEVWKQLLMVFHDWLKSKSIPQCEEFKVMSDDVEVPTEELAELEEEDEEGISSSSGGSEESDE